MAVTPEGPVAVTPEGLRGGASWAGVSGGNRANINTGNINRNVNVSGGGYGG